MGIKETATVTITKTTKEELVETVLLKVGDALNKAAEDIVMSDFSDNEKAMLMQALIGLIEMQANIFKSIHKVLDGK